MRDLMYKATPINTLVEQIITDSQLTHLKFINRECITDIAPVASPLSSAANKELSHFLHSLGRSDTGTQLALINSFRDYISKEEEILKENHSKNSRLYLSFGVFSGVLIALIFV